MIAAMKGVKSVFKTGLLWIFLRFTRKTSHERGQAPHNFTAVSSFYDGADWRCIVGSVRFFAPAPSLELVLLIDSGEPVLPCFTATFFAATRTFLLALVLPARGGGLQIAHTKSALGSCACATNCPAHCVHVDSCTIRFQKSE